MVIIVEGIDRVGKTTLCNKISKEFNIPIHKYKGLVNYKNMKNIEETDKTLGLVQLLSETNSNIIFDRTYFSDYVYGLIERDYEEIEACNNLWILDSEFANLKDVFLILIEPTNLENSSKEHGKDLTLHEKMFYGTFLKSKIKNKFRCTYNTIDEAVIFIKSRMEK